MLKLNPNRVPWSVAINLFWVYVCYAVCRLAFLAENWSLYGDDLTWPLLRRMLYGGWLFDGSAICYMNSLYLLLVLVPLHWKETLLMRRITKWAYVLPNALSIVANLADSVFFPFNGHRTTAMVFDEFRNEDNLGAIFGVELVRHWYLVLLGLAMILLLVKGYRHSLTTVGERPLKYYYRRQIASLVVVVPLAVCGMRGAFFSTATRPIAVSNAHQYVDRPLQTGIVLNTPFAILRTLSTKKIRVPEWFGDPAELDSLYTPVHYPRPDAVQRRKNVVILIVESFAQEFIGARNRHLDDGQYGGYTPFVDSLLEHSLTFEETFCNTRISIDAMPAVLASIPRMERPFVLTPFSLNTINSIATELKNWGYYTAFFHGAMNDSMGFQAVARAAGFTDYFGRTEFNEDPRFDGDAEYDGTWAIWDEPFLQYFCLKMSEMPEPFVTSVFTATSHHPFVIPPKYKEVFKDEGAHLLHKCIRYTDYSLRQFFATAAKQPWYENTIFVLSADHASGRNTYAEYKTDLGHFRIPILIFDPSGELPAGCREGIAQQIDIMPTLLGYLGYDRPYVAFGQDLLHTAPEDTWSLNWVQIPQFIKGDYLLQLEGDQVSGMYAYRTDRLLKENLVGTPAVLEEQTAMERQAKAVIQSYMERMSADRVSCAEQ